MTVAGGPTTDRRSTDDGWQHLHPLSPVLRGGVAFVAVVGYTLSQQTDRIFGAQADDPTQGHRLLAVGVVLAVLLVIVAGAWVSWRFSRFRVSTAFVELRTGLLFRQHRQVPFDRIQAVDISRPVLARLTGLSEVVVQSAGGRNSHLRLAFLTDARAQEVREQLMALAGRGDDAVVVPDDAALPADAVPSDPLLRGAAVVRVPNARLVQASLYSGGAVFLAVAVPTLVVGVVTGTPQLVGWLGPMVLGVGGRHLQRLVRHANFTVHHHGDRLVIRHGLTDLRSTSVPLHRIQAAGLVQPLFWRLPGWWRLEVNVAGAGGGRDEDTETVLLPVGSMREALAVLALVRPGIPEDLSVAALAGEGEAHGFTTASSRARLLDPLSWRRKGYAVTPDSVLLRGGVLHRRAQVVPHARIQAVGVRQGPLQRWRGVASVTLASTPGPVRARVEHLAVPQAELFLREQMARSSRARGGRSPRSGPS
ncbi:PH domain-containing protein [Nostocoides sp. HKS02]|uniref:PH domain-containing protein n=1 Tax=Nostocoides sp. HKS02 TaxID=1813880 RepID=UPI0012B4F3F7|nr:PH domain-containing protein [Tetrasphaera sp. HKS02]QGN57010.1 PH domain-containing protein [Tetrasphaera sp. HKS02]